MNIQSMVCFFFFLKFYFLIKEFSSLEFRDMLELVERTSSLMAKLELNEQIQQAEKVLNEIKQQFDEIMEKKLNEDNEEKTKNFDQLRPTLGHPARKNDLEEIDNREKIRQTELQQVITQLRSNTIVS
jgi:DNA-binding IscR family transcriptional regulator